jgi:hypothetical protein
VSTADERVGTVEFNHPRLFDLDPVGEVMVAPGDYPIYRTVVGAYYWVLTGQPSRHVHKSTRVSDGLFAIRHYDDVDHGAVPVVFQSLLMRDSHIRAEIANPTCRDDGTPYYTISLEVPV